MRGQVGVLGVILVVGCSTDYRLSSVEPTSPPGSEPAGIPGDPGPVGGPSEQVPPVGIPDIQHHEVVLGGGARTEVADYLFVVDSSSSMEGILDKVLDGIDALARDDAFPKDARIGVMNMTPSDPLRPGTVHPAIKNRWWLKFEPGFGDLIDGDRITVFREVAPPYLAERFPAAGCDKWFAPDAKNADGTSCLVANTQISLYPIEVEAGLTALGQRLERDPPLFRSGAAANVVFVTDTHDPGIPADAPGFADLMSIRPTFAQLETEALSREQLASFRIHAIAPASVCTAEDWTAAGPAYFVAAKAGGGETLDSCTATPAQYVDLVRRIATDGAVPTRAVIAVQPEMEVAEVLVDGRPSAFTVSSDGRAVVLPGELSAHEQKVDVQYRVRGEVPILPGRTPH